MKTVELTEAIWQSIDIECIIYAEYAEGGAMGNSGGLIVYTLKNEKLNYYETNIRTDLELYKEISLELISNSNNLPRFSKEEIKLFDYNYGGFGNHTFINLNYSVGILSQSLVLKKGSHEYLILSSCEGVFLQIIKSLEHKTGENFDFSNFIKLRESYPLMIKKAEEERKKRIKDMKAKDVSLGRDLDSVLKKYGKEKLKEILDIINKHDPIDLISIGCPDDEYLTEARSIIVQLKKGKSIENIQNIVYHDFVRWFSRKCAGSKERYSGMAKDIHEWINNTWV